MCPAWADVPPLRLRQIDARRSTIVLHPCGASERLSHMPTAEVTLLILAVVLWIALLGTIAPDA
jgi:hypothetical protein